MDTYLEVDLLVVEVDDGEGAEALSICIVGLLAKHLGSGVFYFLQKSQIVRQSARMDIECGMCCLDDSLVQKVSILLTLLGGLEGARD